MSEPKSRSPREHPARLADPAPFPEDVREEKRLRPNHLEEFVGQQPVRQQLAIVENWDGGMGTLYRDLGLVAVALAENDGKLDARRAAELRDALGRPA